MSEETKPVEQTQELAIDYTKHYKKYYENLAGERMKEISKLAKLDSFTIPIENEETGEWVTETFKYREISTKRWMELEVLRSQYSDLEKIAASTLLNSKEASKYDFAQRLNELLLRLYRLSAKYFLGMTDNQFDWSSWTQIKSIIDACNHRTIFTLPN